MSEKLDQYVVDPEEDGVEAEFTEGGEADIPSGGAQKKVTPKVTDVPFETKEIKEAPKEEVKAERYKKILLDLGFHKKENGGESGKEQYIIKDGDIVIGRTFKEELPTGKFWALRNNKFIDETDVKELKIVQAFYAVREGKKKISEVVKEMGVEAAKKPSVAGGAVQTTDVIVPTTAEAKLQQTPNAVINEAQGMATALYHVVEKQHLYMDIGGKKYLQLEAWQLLGKFCNVHGIVESVRAVEYFGINGFEARAVVIDGEGRRIAEAEAVCMMDEPNWKDKPLFQLKSMAQTRSLSKAYRSSLSFIVSIAGYAATPAEEMQGV